MVVPTLGESELFADRSDGSTREEPRKLKKKKQQLKIKTEKPDKPPPTLTLPKSDPSMFADHSSTEESFAEPGVMSLASG